MFGWFLLYLAITARELSLIKIMSIANNIPNESYSHQLRESLSKQSGMSIAASPSKKETFISKVERFQSSSTIVTPGPGAYQQILSEKHTIDFRSSKVKEPAINSQHAWINDRQRLSYIPSKSSINQVGPGQYQDISKYGGGQSHSNWAKGQRFSQLTGIKNNLGPGSYDSKMSLKQAVAPVAVFRSKSPRTFIQQMIQKSAKEAKRNHNPQEEKSAPDEVIKFDETQYLVRRKVDKLSPVFMSKAQRQKLASQNTSTMLGPGTYSSQKVTHKPIETRAPRSSIHYTSTLYNEGEKSSDIGPGSYNFDIVLGSQKFGRRQTLGFISKSERFEKSHSQKKPALSPGPGQYMQNRFTLIKEEDLRFKSKGSFTRKPQKNHNFGQALRTTLRNPNNSPFGEYSLKNYDISTKLQRQKHQYQKLKMMQVTLPAFNTKQHH